MRKPYLVYIVGADEETQHVLWRAFSRTFPECLLYFFLTSYELLDHLSHTQDKPDLVLADSSGRQALSSSWHQPVNSRVLSDSVARLEWFLTGQTPLWHHPKIDEYVVMPAVLSYQQAVQLVRQFQVFWTRQHPTTN